MFQQHVHKHGDRIRSYCQQLVNDEKVMRASPTGSMGHLVPDTADSFSTNFNTPEESFRDAMPIMEPPTALTVAPESTLEDAVNGSRSGLFKLPPPALLIDETDDLLAVTGLVPRKETRARVLVEEPPRLTPSNTLFTCSALCSVIDAFLVQLRS